MSEDKFGLVRSFIRHRAFVGDAIERVCDALRGRARVHDLSKMLDDEFEGFSRINAAARIHKFGSPEYQAGIDAERGTVDLHYLRNSHHPERPKMMGEAAEKDRGGPDDFTYWMAHDRAAMTFLDVIEMVCDWHGARNGYDDPRPWAESAKMNLEAKGKHLTDNQRWLAEQVVGFFESNQ